MNYENIFLVGIYGLSQGRGKDAVKAWDESHLNEKTQMISQKRWNIVIRMAKATARVHATKRDRKAEYVWIRS
jgi:hypothetical protein